MNLHFPTVEKVAVIGIVAGGLGWVALDLYQRKAAATAADAAAAAQLGPEATAVANNTLPLALDVGSGGLLDNAGYSLFGTGSLAASILDEGQQPAVGDIMADDTLSQLNPSGLPEISFNPVANTAPFAGT